MPKTPDFFQNRTILITGGASGIAARPPRSSLRKVQTSSLPISMRRVRKLWPENCGL